MIIYNNIKYKINGNDGETLYRISRRKHDVLYFIDKLNGFGFNCHGLPFQFTTRENGCLFFQHTFCEDKETFKEQYKKERRENWALNCFC